MRTRNDSPFSLPVRDIVHKPGQMREHAFDVTLAERWGEGIVAVEDGAAVEITVRLESVHEGILATGNADTRFDGVCGRCLREISEPVEVEFVELFAYPGEEETDFEVQDDHVDLEILVRDAVVLSLPFQPVCQPDCPGLDPNTGERLTESAVIQHSEPVDPRWAALQDFTPDVPRSRGEEPTEES